MNLNLYRAILCCSFFVLCNGCTTFQIVDLNSEVIVNDEYAKSPVNSVIGVDLMDVIASEYSDANHWQQGLEEAIIEEGILTAVTYPNEKATILVHGKVKGDFRHEGAKNFFTWWPGALIFAHMWRGTHYIYDAQADVTVTDLSNGQILGNYHANSSYELTHTSGNPFPLLGALMVVPGIIKGAISVSPRTKYRQKMYEVVYSELWKKIAVNIANGQAKKYSQRIDLLRKLCGINLNNSPKVDDNWLKFTACQIRKYRLLGQDSINEQIVSVYVSDDNLYRVQVGHDGLIVRWNLFKEE